MNKRVLTQQARLYPDGKHIPSLGGQCQFFLGQHDLHDLGTGCIGSIFNVDLYYSVIKKVDTQRRT